MKFIIKLIAWTTCAAALRTATLNHKVWNNTMKIQSVVVWRALRLVSVFQVAFCKRNKITDRSGSFFMGKTNTNASFFCVKNSEYTFVHNYFLRCESRKKRLVSYFTEEF